MTNLNPFFPRHAFLFKGGGPSAADVPPPTPPVTERATEVYDARQQAKKDAAKRKGQTSTLLAGETGGYRNPFTVDQNKPKTLLGGG